MNCLLLQRVVLAIVDFLGKQQNLIKTCYVEYPWQKHLNCVSYSGSGANGSLHSSICGKGCLDNYKIRLIKRLCSLAELFSCLKRKAYHEIMIQNKWVLTSAIFPISRWLILDSALSFWLAFLHVYFNRHLRFSLLSSTIQIIFFSVIFAVAVSLKEKCRNDSFKPKLGNDTYRY